MHFKILFPEIVLSQEFPIFTIGNHFRLHIQ